MCRIGTSIWTESRSVVVYDNEGWREMAVIANRYRISFQHDEDVLRLIVVMVVQLQTY